MAYKLSELVADVDREQPEEKHASAPDPASGDTMNNENKSDCETELDSATTGASNDAETTAVAARTTGDPVAEGADDEGTHTPEPIDDGAANTPDGGNSGANDSRPVAAIGTNDKPSKHSLAGKIERAIELAAAGKIEEANAIKDSIKREKARRSARSTKGAAMPKFHFLLPAWREQWAGQDVRDICQTLAKTVAKRDTSGTAAFAHWKAAVLDILRTQRDAEVAAADIAGAIQRKDVERNTGERIPLVNGLNEIQVKVAELMRVDPREWVRPGSVNVSDADSGTADAVSANPTQADSEPTDLATADAAITEAK